MSSEALRKLSPEDALREISAHIATYLRGGPNRKAGDIKLAAASGLAVESVTARWKATEGKRPAWMSGLDRLTRDWAGWLAEGLAIVGAGLASAEEVAEVAEAQGWPADEGQEPARAEALAYFEAGALPEPEPQAEGENEEAELSLEDEGAARALLAKLGLSKGEQSKELVPVGANPVLVPEPIKELNDKHAVIGNLGGRCVVMEWVPSRVTEGAKELSFQSFTSFKERYANRYVDLPDGRGRTGSVPGALYWLAHPHRRQYEGIDLVPNGPAVLPGGYLNLWRGWGVEPRKGSWKLMQRHIAEVLSNGSQEFEDYILRWTAWKFQNLGVPPEVVLALLGGKGAGKGVWGYTLMRIFGEHGLQIFSTDLLIGKHNAHLQNKLFLFLDEAMWAGDRNAERVLKGITTEKWMMIEPKGINAFQWPNRLGVLMSGNDNWIVPASHDERRYAVNRVSERWKQDKSYFGPLFAEVNDGGAAAMLYDLLRLDLDGWHPRENVPQTPALVEQKMLGLTGLEQWYVEMLSIGELPRPKLGQLPGAGRKNPRRVAAKVLFESAKAFSPRNKFINETELGRFLKDQGCVHHSDGKGWGWVFPPLDEARNAWRDRAGGTWEWLAPDIGDWGEKPEG